MDKKIMSLKLRRCPNGHQYTQFCSVKNCKNPSIYCRQSCNSHQHNNCSEFCSLIDIQNMLKTQNQKLFRQNDPVLDFFDDVQKQLNVLKESYIKTKQEQNWLQGSYLNLFQLLKSNQHDKILPNLINSVKNQNSTILESQQIPPEIKSFKEQKKQFISRLKIIFQQARSRIQQILKWNKIDWKFDPKFCAKSFLSDYFKIQNLGCKLTKIKQTIPCFALITPSLELNKLQKTIKLTLISGDNNVFFGIGSYNQIKQQKFLDKKENFVNTKGTYYITCGGVTFNSSFPSQNRIQTKFSCRQKEVVVMQLDFISNLLTIFNQNNFDVQVKLKFETNKNDNLHVLVGMWKANSCVQILPIQDQFPIPQ